VWAKCEQKLQLETSIFTFFEYIVLPHTGSLDKEVFIKYKCHFVPFNRKQMATGGWYIWNRVRCFWHIWGKMTEKVNFRLKMRSLIIKSRTKQFPAKISQQCCGSSMFFFFGSVFGSGSYFSVGLESVFLYLKIYFRKTPLGNNEFYYIMNDRFYT
jgi:hypothetical protein